MLRPGLAVLATLLFAGDAGAAPEITVRARTAIELEPIRRIPGGIEVAGRVEDRASGEAVPFAEVEIQVDDQLAQIVAGEDGGFEERFPVGEGLHDLSVAYGGDTHYSAAATERPDFDVTKRPVTLTVRADDRVSSAGGAIPVAVIARSEGEPISIRVELWAGDTSDDELRRVGAVATDAAGRATTPLDREGLGGPGRKRIEARFAGDEAFDRQVASTTLLFTSTTELSFSLDDELVKFEGRVRGTGRLTDRYGEGIEGAAIALVSGDDTLRRSVTGERGSFVLSVPASELGPGSVNLQAVFEAERPWLEDSRSRPITAKIAERQPVPVGYTLAAFGATCMALLAFVGLRTRPWAGWLERLRRADEDDPEETDEDAERPVHTGLAPARPSLVSTLRRAHDFGFTGSVRNAVTGRPVAGARVGVTHAEHGEEAREVGADGHFEIEGLRAGEWQVEVRAPGFVTERFALSIPHRGELRHARVDLLPVREKIFALYRRVAAPLLPDPGLWGIWTPRQIFDHVRERRRAAALAALTDYVEWAYFSYRPLEEDAVEEARERADAARREGHG